MLANLAGELALRVIIFGLKHVFGRVQTEFANTLTLKDFLRDEEVFFPQLFKAIQKQVFKVRLTHLQLELESLVQHRMRLRLTEHVNHIWTQLSADDLDEVLIVCHLQLKPLGANYEHVALIIHKIVLR